MIFLKGCIFYRTLNYSRIEFIKQYLLKIQTIFNTDLPSMEATNTKADPRFAQFQDQFDSDNVPIGFKIPDNEFLFEYDSAGGWLDQNGKHFNKYGQPTESDNEDEKSSSEDSESDVDDDEILDEFQQMLLEEEEGIIRPKKQNKTKQPAAKIDKQTDFEAEAKQFIQRLKNKEQIRQGFSYQICIFFKMRSNLYETINSSIQKIQSVKDKNVEIKKIRASLEQKRKLLASNTWLSGQFYLDYSGTSLETGVYDRYWYGWVKISPENYLSSIQKINNSKQFAILKSKTFHALKSKFYLKTKMKETINKLKQELKDGSEEDAVTIRINNLPEQFPLSFILDLIELCGGNLNDVEDINIIDDFSAEMVVKKGTALILTNIQGYSHDVKQYIWIETENLKRPFKNGPWFNIQVDAEFKVPTMQLFDTLALLNNKDEIVQMYQKGQVYRLVANQNVIRKILMFRGQTLNIVRIIRYQKVVAPEN